MHTREKPACDHKWVSQQRQLRPLKGKIRKAINVAKLVNWQNMTIFSRGIRAHAGDWKANWKDEWQSDHRGLLKRDIGV